MNPQRQAGGGLHSVIMPSYALYSDTAGAVNSDQCLPRKREQEGEECRGPSAREEALVWG